MLSKSSWGTTEVDAWLAETRTLDVAVAETLTLAADDVLLDELLSSLSGVVGAERLLLGASVYREPVDLNALLFQVGEHDESVARAPNRPEAVERIQEVLSAAGVEVDADRPLDLASLPRPLQQALAPHLQEFQSLPVPPRSTPVNLTNLVAACQSTSLLSVDTNSREPEVFVHRWTATEMERRWSAQDRQDEVIAAHRRAADYWQWRFGVPEALATVELLRQYRADLGPEPFRQILTDIAGTERAASVLTLLDEAEGRNEDAG